MKWMVGLYFHPIQWVEQTDPQELQYAWRACPVQIGEEYNLSMPHIQGLSVNQLCVCWTAHTALTVRAARLPDSADTACRWFGVVQSRHLVVV